MTAAGRLVAGWLVFAVLLLAACAPSASDPVPTPGTASTSPTAPAEVDDATVARVLADGARRNEGSGRGMYEWLEQPSLLPDWPMPDLYWRDQLQWGAALERRPGRYDFSVIDRGLAQAEARHGRFSFRVMSWCPGCGENLTPKWIPRQASGVPDWNSEKFLQGYESLMAALGKKYNGDPRLGTVDVGAYGMWGEWYCDDSCGTRITEASARRLVKAAADAFPEHYVIMGFDVEMGPRLLEYSDRIGVRFDCVGGMWTTLRTFPERFALVWRRAPVLGEWCNLDKTTPAQGLDNVRELHLSALSSGNYPRRFSQMNNAEKAGLAEVYSATGFHYSVAVDSPLQPAGGRLKVATRWTNAGVAPSYDDWALSLVVVSDAGREVARTPLPVSLRKVTDQPVTDETTVPVDGLPAGHYRLVVVGADRHGYLPPVALADAGRDDQGRYPLGEFRLG